MNALVLALAALLAAPPVGGMHLLGPRKDVEPPPLPPGGYYGVGEVPEIPPPDGQAALITGSALVPLGALRLGLGVGQWALARPDRCTYEASTCQSLTALGYAGAGLGALMLGTGVVFLGIGLTRRNRLRRWKEARNLAWSAEPMQLRGGAGARFEIAF